MSNNSIFICHSSIDKTFVEKLAEDLLDNGIDVWFDKWEIKVGDSLILKINSGILESSRMGVVLSPNSIKSQWVQKELSAGLIKEIQKKQVVVLPILMEPCTLPPLLSDKKYADFTNDYQNGLSELLKAFYPSKKSSQEIKRKPSAKGHLYI